MINLNDLNSKQLEAVTSMKNTMVVASAGTGKTRVLTYHLAYLISQGVDPKHIYAFTFTNKAAREMKQRVTNLNYVRVNIKVTNSDAEDFTSFGK